MPSDATLIVLSILSFILMVIFFEIRDRKKFKWHLFKDQQSMWRKQQNLQFKKWAKEQGLTDDNKKTLAGLDTDTLASLAKQYLGGEVSTDREGIIGALVNFAEDNPEMVKGFLEGITKGGGSEETGGER